MRLLLALTSVILWFALTSLMISFNFPFSSFCFEAHFFFSVSNLSAISLRMTVVLISSIFHFLLVVPSGRPPLLLEATVEELVTGLDELDIVEVISELMEAAWEGGVVPAVEGVEEVERLDIDEEERPTRTWAISIVSGTIKEG